MIVGHGWANTVFDDGPPKICREVQCSSFDRGRIRYPICGDILLDNVASDPPHQLPSLCQILHRIPIPYCLHPMIELVSRGGLLKIQAIEDMPVCLLGKIN